MDLSGNVEDIVLVFDDISLMADITKRPWEKKWSNPLELIHL